MKLKAVRKSGKLKAAGFILVTLMLMTLIFIPQTAANITTTLGVLYVNAKLEELNERINRLAYLDMKLSMMNASLGLLSSTVRDLNRQVMMLNTLVSNINAWILGWENTWRGFKAEYNAHKENVERAIEQLALAVAKLEEEVNETENLIKILYGTVVPIHYDNISAAIDAGETKITVLNMDDYLYAPDKQVHLILLNSTVLVIAAYILTVEGDKESTLRFFAGVTLVLGDIKDVKVRFEGRVTIFAIKLSNVYVDYLSGDALEVHISFRAYNCIFEDRLVLEPFVHYMLVHESEIVNCMLPEGATVKIHYTVADTNNIIRFSHNTFGDRLEIYKLTGYNPRHIHLTNNKFSVDNGDECVYLENVAFSIINANVFHVKPQKTGLRIVNGDRLMITNNFFMAFNTVAINANTNYTIISNNQIIGSTNITGVGNIINNNL